MDFGIKAQAQRIRQSFGRAKACGGVSRLGLSHFIWPQEVILLTARFGRGASNPSGARHARLSLYRKFGVCPAREPLSPSPLPLRLGVFA
jgi:hypothetical protein